MKIKFLRSSLGLSLGLTALLSASTLVHAARLEVGQLGISNQTDHPLSFSINKLCSTDIGDISAYSIKSIDLPTILKICATSITCEIVGYDAQSCRGNQIGSVNINFMHHQMEILNSKNPDNITIGGSIGLYEYNVFFNQS